MIIENKGAHYECPYCGADRVYIENGGKCECALSWQIFSHSGGFIWGYESQMNNVDDILESKRLG